jgi:hypothetical protein
VKSFDALLVEETRELNVPRLTGNILEDIVTIADVEVRRQCQSLGEDECQAIAHFQDWRSHDVPLVAMNPDA